MSYRHDTLLFGLNILKYPSLIIHLKQILHSRKTKTEIETDNTIEHEVTSYQVKKTMV